MIKSPSEIERADQDVQMQRRTSTFAGTSVHVTRLSPPQLGLLAHVVGRARPRHRRPRRRHLQMRQDFAHRCFFRQHGKNPKAAAAMRARQNVYGKRSAHKRGPVNPRRRCHQRAVLEPFPVFYRQYVRGNKTHRHRSGFGGRSERVVRPRQLAKTGTRGLVGLPREAREPCSVSGTTDPFGDAREGRCMSIGRPGMPAPRASHARTRTVTAAITMARITLAVPGPITLAVPKPITLAVPGPITLAVPRPITSAVPGPITLAVPTTIS
jgi:hypothetical protein